MSNNIENLNGQKKIIPSSHFVVEWQNMKDKEIILKLNRDKR